MIGIFNDNFPPILDGVALTAKNYADWLSRKGQDVCVVTPYAPEFPADLTYPLYSFFSVPIPGRAPYRYGLPHFDSSFKHLFNTLQFELIHAHCPFTTGMLALRTGRQQNIPIVATFHSKYRQDFEHAVKCRQLVDYAVKRVIQFYEQADEVWIPQTAVEPTLREYGYKGHVEVVSNGNDFVTPEPVIEKMRISMRAELGLHSGQTMLLYVGQFTWEKNIRFTLDALLQISHLPFRFYMIGRGYAESEIRQFVKKHGLDNKIILLGMMQNRELLKRYYAAADLFMFPSTYDTFGLVIREAAAMRTPSVLLAGSTAASEIEDGYNGFMTPNDISKYAMLIKYLMENPDVARQTGINASITLSRSWENVVEEVIDRYKDIIVSHKQGLKK